MSPLCHNTPIHIEVFLCLSSHLSSAVGHGPLLVFVFCSWKWVISLVITSCFIHREDDEGVGRLRSSACLVHNQTNGHLAVKHLSLSQTKK